MAEVYPFVAVAPAMKREGLDSELLQGIVEIDSLIRDMRCGVSWPNQVWDRETAVKRYLIYLSILIDSVLPDIIMSALAAHDLMVMAKLRLLLEYATKAAYFSDHPDYALYMMTVNEAKQVLEKLKAANSEQDAIDSASEALRELEARFPDLAGLKKLSFDVLMADYGDKSAYVWLYRAPSVVVHGDPEGIRKVIEVFPDGSQKIHMEFPLDEINGMIVDAGTNVLMFCNHFIGTFSPDDETLKNRFLGLHRKFLSFVLKHSGGRDAYALAAVEKEIAELDGGQPIP